MVARCQTTLARYSLDIGLSFAVVPGWARYSYDEGPSGFSTASVNPSFGSVGPQGDPPREVLVHMVEQYVGNNGHTSAPEAAAYPLP